VHDYAGHAHDQDHSHHRHHEDGEACNRMVEAKEVAGPLSWRKVAAVVLSVGVRPCSGAIVMLVFALTQGLFWAGGAAIFAMAFGTAITVAVLATLALNSREFALKFGGDASRWVMRCGRHALSAGRWSCPWQACSCLPLRHCFPE
jgi:nickel/cobalt exporter